MSIILSVVKVIIIDKILCVVIYSLVHIVAMVSDLNRLKLTNKLYIVVCNIHLHASVVHASGSGQLQANPHVAGPWLSPGKPTRRAITTMGSNDLVVGEVHMLGPSCQRYNWHTGRCGSIAFGSSPRRGKTLISSPRCLAVVSTRGKDFRR